jgi:citrate lyase beta subunit
VTEGYGRTTKRNPATIQRSLLSVPGFNPYMVEKALLSEADAILLDLEDAITPDEKAGARETIGRAVKERGWRSWRGRPTLYRANALDTPAFYRDLIEVVEAAGDALDAVIIPKVNRPEDLHAVATLLNGLELATGLDPGKVRLEAQIESAEGPRQVDAIARVTERLTASCATGRWLCHPGLGTA